MRPYDVKGDKIPPLAELRTDHKEIGDYWILTDGWRVSMVQQKTGESPTQKVTIPRAEFNRMIDWYLRDQKRPAKKKRS